MKLIWLRKLERNKSNQQTENVGNRVLTCVYVRKTVSGEY